MRKGDCCTIAGWGKTASDRNQLNEFIAKEKKYEDAPPGYRVLYDAKTPLFPNIPNRIADRTDNTRWFHN